VLRHEPQPGKLVAGLVLALAGVMYAGDAGGLWDTPWFAIIPLVTVGLCLAGVIGLLTRGIRRRRRRNLRAGRPGPQDPAGTRGPADPPGPQDPPGPAASRDPASEAPQR
jgi:hypothetical protein